MASLAPSSMAAPASSQATTALEAHIPEEDLQTLQLFIENALDLMLKGNSTSYQFLIQQLNPLSGKSDVATRRKIFLALPRCISTMAKEPKAYHQLLDVLFKFDFLGAREEIDAYTRFVVHLVSSNTVYVLPLLQMLVRNMCRPQQLPPALAPAPVAAAPVRAGRISIGGSFGAAVALPPPAPVAPAIDIEKRFQERYDDVHATLQRVLKLAPTATNALFPVVVEHFPHKRLDAPFQVAYLRNVLKLCTYVPGLQERIFALIIDRLVAVDVEIKLDEKEEDVFTMDDFLDDDLLPGDGASHLDEMAEKLDHMMVIMFEHIERQVYATTTNGETTTDGAKPLKGDQASLLFKFLLKVFEHSILNTHRSKYPQFLLFYVCQLDPQFQDVFISQLLSASLDPQTPPVTRHSCGAYLASFLARAKYISVAYIQKALYHLLKWMHDQMDIYDNTFLQQQAPTSDDDDDGASGEGGGKHDGESTSHKARRGMEAEAEDLEKNKRGYFHESIYISTLQTVCYLVCFRGLELTQSENGYEFLRSLGWERLLITQTSYCPLAFCQPTVAIEFLNFAETFDLVSEECIDKVDQAINSIGRMQKRTKGSKSMERTAPPPTAVVMSSSNMPASLSGSSVLGLRQPLETFFPFDPYLLRRSFRFIGPLYLYWKHADPTSSENADALNTVKEIIRAYHENEEDEDGSDDDDQDQDDDDDDDDDGDDDESESMAISTSITMASFREESYLSTSHNYSMSIDSTLDDDDRAMAAAYGMGMGMGMGMGVSTHSLGSSSDMPRRIKRSRRALTPRSTFAPSPALSASSPPSQLPPLDGSGGGMRNGFALSGYGDDDDDEGF